MAPQHIYDVFLSFSGFDTRHNFTSHLLAALEQHGIHTFRDDRKLNKGEYIRYELLKAIEESRISLIVLSKSYATSSWCLDELVKIMECRKALQQIVLPIFYYVEPSDVRVQKGSLAEAFSNHEECFKEGSDGRVEKWREALTEVANLSGWDVPKVANGDEAHLIWKVVEEVQNKLYLAHVHVACHQIGLEFRLKKFKTEPDDVPIAAIWGSGGIGKTVIAKKLCNLIRHEFEGSSMASSSSSANTENEYPTYPTCKCGKAAPLRRSKTIANQERRFSGCANYEIRQKRCNYLYWVDPPTRERELEAKKVGLERNSKDLGKMIHQPSKEKKKKKMTAQEAKVNLKRELMAQEAKANFYKLKCLMLIVACIILIVACIILWLRV